MPRTHLVTAPKSIATYQIQTKLYEIKEAATILLTFSLASLPDGFVTIPGCILACKWVNCHGCTDCCCCNCASLDEIALDESKLRKEAVESRGCGCQVIGWLAVAFCCDIGFAADVAVTGFFFRPESRSWLGYNQVQIGIAILLYIFATALPALIYAIKLHRKVNELIAYLDHSSVFGPLMGDIEANTAAVLPQNTSGRAPPPPPPPGCGGVYQHPPQQAVQTGMQMGQLGAHPTATV